VLAQIPFVAPRRTRHEPDSTGRSMTAFQERDHSVPIPWSCRDAAPAMDKN
jgi:hypothetical protein